MGGLVGSIPVWVQCTPRGQLPFSAATSRSFPPSTPSSRIVDFVVLLRLSLSLPPSLSLPHLSPTFFFCLSSPLPFFLSFFLSPDTYSFICPYRSLLFSSRLVNRRIPPGEEKQGRRDKSGRVSTPRGSKEDSLRMVIVRRNSRQNVRAGLKREGEGLAPLLFFDRQQSSASDNGEHTTSLFHFFPRLVRVDSPSSESSLGPAESSCTPSLLADGCAELRDRLTSSAAFLDITNNNSNLGFSREDKLYRQTKLHFVKYF